MPYPDAPPYAVEPGAVTQPRQLQRWLDVNKVPVLTRTRGYFTLPAFSVETQWKGYSEIVAAFNYEAPNKFSLKNITSVNDPNYVACVAWVDSEYVMHRYALWTGAGEVFHFSAPLYTGQVIGRNFRIEIWNVALSDVLSFSVAGDLTGNAMDGNYLFNGANERWEKIGTTTKFFEFDSLLYDSYVAKNTTFLVVANLANPDYFPFGIWLDAGGNPTTGLYAYQTTTCDNASDLTLYTSVLGGYDYRFQDDFVLVSTTGIVEDFNVSTSGGVFTLPIEFPAGSYPTLN